MFLFSLPIVTFYLLSLPFHFAKVWNHVIFPRCDFTCYSTTMIFFCALFFGVIRLVFPSGSSTPIPVAVGSRSTMLVPGHMQPLCSWLVFANILVIFRANFGSAGGLPLSCLKWLVTLLFWPENGHSVWHLPRRGWVYLGQYTCQSWQRGHSWAPHKWGQMSSSNGC